MARLTNLEIYKYAQVKYDKVNSPHIPKFQWMLMYSESRLEWLRLKTKDFEVTSLQRSDLRSFIRDVDFGDVQQVILTESLNIAFIVGVWADFNYECGGSSTLYTAAFKTLTIDEAAEVMRDPFNQPNDEFPAYVEKNNGQNPYLDLLSTTLPTGVSVYFIKKPKPYDLILDPEGFTEEDEAQQYDIIDIAVKKYELSIENLNKFQGMREEITSNGS